MVARSGRIGTNGTRQADRGLNDGSSRADEHREFAAIMHRGALVAVGTAQPADFGPIDGTGRRVIDLTGLVIADGFAIIGDLAGDQAGTSVASAGDVNGDGFADIIIGAPQGDDGGSGAGEAYVIFGKATGFGTIDLTTLAPADGFIIQGDIASDNLGISVASAGDFNNDGFDDVIVGTAGSAGRAYVILGRNGSFGAVDGTGRSVIDLTGLAPADGFSILGIAGVGRTVSSAGDINNDGFEDIIVGGPNATGGGVAYVIFGHGGPLASINATALTPAEGFIIRGDLEGDRAGASLSPAGDVNNDGFDDLIVGAPGGNLGGGDAGEAYVIFGRSGTFGTPDGSGHNVIDLGELSAADGFVIRGDSTSDSVGTGVSSAGDIDGDGFDDVIVGGPFGDDGGMEAGEAYVIFGKSGGFGAPDAAGRRVIDLTTLGWDQGFIIRGDTADDRLGVSVSAAGDINGDGYDDLIVGANRGDDGGSNAGEAYVIFGSALGFGTSDSTGRNVIDLTTLGIAEGFIIQGDLASDSAGSSVSAAGDINDDGYDDLIVSAPMGDDGGSSAGESYIIFGRDFSTVGSPTAGNDRIEGTPDADTLDGLAGNDRIFGLGGNDTLSGGAGADTLIGGQGDDTYFLDNSSDSVVEAVGEGTDIARTSTHYALRAGSEVEVIAAADEASTVALNLTGNEFGQELRGNAGANILNGGGTLSVAGGIDTLRGFGGNDTYYVDSADDVVVETAGNGFDILYTDAASYVLAAGVEIEAMSALTRAFNLTGNELGQQLFGNHARNVLNGGGGQDALYGGDGDDDYYVQSDDVISEIRSPVNGGGNATGFDRVFASTSYNLVGQAGDFEYLSAADTASTTAIDLTGTGTQQIIGNAGANTLRGGLSLTGLGGNDVYYIASASTVVVEAAAAGFDIIYTSINYTLAAGLSIEVIGSIGAAILIGNELGQQIIGGSYLDGGGGADALYGQGGDDIYIVQGDDVIVEAANAGFDIAYTSTSMTLTAGASVEVLSANDLNATIALNLTGNEFGQQIFGNAGANMLVAGAGADALYGYGGDDSYFVDGLDVVIEEAGGGFDAVYSSTGFTLLAGVEAEILSVNDYSATVALNLTGNEYNQQIFGNAGANTLNGGGGADYLYGNGGNDVYLVDGNDTVVEDAGAGFDQVYASASYALSATTEVEILSVNDYSSTAAINLVGNAFGQQLFGNAGANILNGGLGNDQLVGNAGADTFAFTTGLGTGNVDIISDFSAADDTIALDRNAFTGLTAGALNPNAFVIGAAAQDTDDRILYDQATGRLFFDADGSGVGAAVQFATLTGAPLITASDFTVI